MMQVKFSNEMIESLATEIKKQLAPLILQEINVQKELPPLLTRKEFMELVGISGTKCAELFNRADFPVIRDFGHPRVPTRLLFEWIDLNAGWVNANAPNLNRAPFRVI
ncbi:hypothetical protein BEP19_09985 [Ammoniphilus oxalaticus]|uniref:Uncharacterized protein n=1 Tax=Ammoniphilus oxalaticus TaxID=66863 RepID=A0A419SFL9_9BACL|nr:DNA-binding protein [Ammoniphilus oxalaticus]RKD22581.1 hypothetical protein BEP19_09985 [Ammoniphilus oxalaticus]